MIDSVASECECALECNKDCWLISKRLRRGRSKNPLKRLEVAVPSCMTTKAPTSLRLWPKIARLFSCTQNSRDKEMQSHFREGKTSFKIYGRDFGLAKPTKQKAKTNRRSRRCLDRDTHRFIDNCRCYWNKQTGKITDCLDRSQNIEFFRRCLTNSLNSNDFSIISFGLLCGEGGHHVGTRGEMLGWYLENGRRRSIKQTS